MTYPDNEILLAVTKNELLTNTSWVNLKIIAKQRKEVRHKGAYTV